MKERAARMMGKSVSFKSANSGRSNVSESKVKMLSSKVTPLQDLKGLKQGKERSTIERKNLSKLERPLVSLTTSSAMVSTPKVDQASRGETSLLSSVSNLREHKAVLSDGKLSTSSKATSSLTCTQSSPGKSCLGGGTKLISFIFLYIFCWLVFYNVPLSQMVLNF